jgi:hypothetical protein
MDIKAIFCKNLSLLYFNELLKEFFGTKAKEKFTKWLK